MRLAITLARKHDATAFELVQGTDVSIRDHASGFKEIRRQGKTHPDYAEVQVWVSDLGAVSRAKFVKPESEKPAPTPAPKKSSKKAPAKAGKKSAADPAPETAPETVADAEPDPETPVAESDQNHE